MTATVAVKLPLVRATRAAREQAARVLPAGVILENAVTAAIAAGHCRRQRGENDHLRVYLGEGLSAIAFRDWSVSNPTRKAWLIVAVHPTTPTRPHRAIAVAGRLPDSGAAPSESATGTRLRQEEP
jgi:hypothetical protein